jgi:hypothetical protein
MACRRQFRSNHYIEKREVMDEFGETPNIYVWPKDHIEGNPLPEDFHQRLGDALTDAGFDWEMS